MKIGERIKERRKQLGMSAEALAAQIGKSAATVYRYEKGEIEKVDSKLLIPIADALKTTPADLMGWENADLHEKLDPAFSSNTPAAKKLQSLSASLGASTLGDSEERELIGIYRDLNDLGKQALMAAARGFATTPAMKKDGVSPGETTA